MLYFFSERKTWSHFTMTGMVYNIQFPQKLQWNAFERFLTAPWYFRVKRFSNSNTTFCINLDIKLQMIVEDENRFKWSQKIMKIPCFKLNASSTIHLVKFSNPIYHFNRSSENFQEQEDISHCSAIPAAKEGCRRGNDGEKLANHRYKYPSRTTATQQQPISSSWGSRSSLQAYICLNPIFKNKETFQSNAQCVMERVVGWIS